MPENTSNPDPFVDLQPAAVEPAKPAVPLVAAFASNPANDREKDLNRLRAQRQPMTGRRRKGDVPNIPGFYLYWFKEENVPEAIAAGYVHVKRGEVSMAPHLMGGGPDGNTDLGTNVSFIGDKTESGTPVRAYLMKIYEELHQDDMQEHAKNNAKILEAIFGDEVNAPDINGNLTARDPSTYRPQKPLFNKPARKAVIGRRPR